MSFHIEGYGDVPARVIRQEGRLLITALTYVVQAEWPGIVDLEPFLIKHPPEIVSPGNLLVEPPQDDRAPLGFTMYEIRPPAKLVSMEDENHVYQCGIDKGPDGELHLHVFTALNKRALQRLNF